MKREEQRENTRSRIVKAAFDVFSEQGFDAASTRAIAEAASVSQGLLTYHFSTKQDLWKAAVEHLFGLARTEVLPISSPETSSDSISHSRDAIRSFVRFLGHHPQLFRFMIDTSADDRDRRKWLVETHLRGVYDRFAATIGAQISSEDRLAPHLFYVMVGAGSLIFAIGDEVAQLTGLDVRADETVDAHADLVARLLLPE